LRKPIFFLKINVEKGFKIILDTPITNKIFICFKCRKKGGGCPRAYFLVLELGFAVLVLGFSATVFIGVPQQTISHGSQPHGSSTISISPQSSHWYLSPFLFAKNTPA
jgi:hypothetical protein